MEYFKSLFERTTGLGVPSAALVKSRVKKRKAATQQFRDDGVIPNNPRCAFIYYRSAVILVADCDPAAMFEKLFESNGWRGSWRNGIYDYVHYHPRIHEVLGIARGHGRVRFGGRRGKIVTIKAGDVAVVPAGTGHQLLSGSADLLVVGAYPPAGIYDEYRASKAEHQRALKMIPHVKRPRKDPVYGMQGPLLKIWRR